MRVAAVVLAAGLSRRMGTPKMLLPWGDTTVLGRILRTLHTAGVVAPLVVVGFEHKSLESICRAEGATAVLNPEFETGEMLSSLQVGLRAVPPDCEAALVLLGDQPALQASVVEAVLKSGQAALSAALVVPSYRLQRGHPWLLGSDWWQEILRMKGPETPRDFLHRHSQRIEHVEVDSDTILRDIDTRDEYLKSAP